MRKVRVEKANPPPVPVMSDADLSALLKACEAHQFRHGWADRWLRSGGSEGGRRAIFETPPVGAVRRVDPLTSVSAARRCRAPERELTILDFLAAVRD